MKQKKSRARNLFKNAKGPNADALREKLARMPPLDFDAVATWIACQPEAGVILRSHAFHSGLLAYDEEAGVWRGKRVAEAQARWARGRA